MKRQTAINVLMLLVSTAIALALVEVGLRLFAHDLADNPVASHPRTFFRYDPELGWADAPSVRGVFYGREFTHDVRINRFGLRGDEITLEKPAGMRRIAVIGDSFVWGIGAQESELFATLIAQRIPNTQVLNFGVPGYGPVHYNLLARKALQFDPDVVIVSFCLNNDFGDAVFWRRWNSYKPFARLDEGGKLVIDGYPIPNVSSFPSRYASGFLGWLYARSYLFRGLDKHALALIHYFQDPGQKGPPDFDESDIYLFPDKPSVHYVVDVTGKLLQGLVSEIHQHGIPVIALAIPTKCELGDCYGMKSPSDAARKALARALGAAPVALIDPSDAFRMDDFWAGDWHWRASGHRKIADAVVPAVRAVLTRHADEAPPEPRSPESPDGRRVDR